MTENEPKEQQIKICVLGGKTVGKTRLIHKLAGGVCREEYEETKEVERFASNLTSQGVSFAFYDFPTLEGLKMKDAVHLAKANLIIFLFKDSSSFTELYQLLEKLSKLSAERQVEEKYVWQEMPIIYLVYSNYQEQTVVQTAQIFSILSEEIRNFNTKAEIKEFLWRREDVLASELREDILKIDFFAKKEEEEILESNIESSNIYDSNIEKSQELQISRKNDIHQDVHPDINLVQNSQLTANDFSETVKVEEPANTEQNLPFQAEKGIQAREIVVESQPNQQKREQIIQQANADKFSQRQQSTQINNQLTIEREPAKQQQTNLEEKHQQEKQERKQEQNIEKQNQFNAFEAQQEANRRSFQQQPSRDINHTRKDHISPLQKEELLHQKPKEQLYEQTSQKPQQKPLLEQDNKSEEPKLNEKQLPPLEAQNSNDNIEEQQRNLERQKQQRQEKKALRLKKNELMRPQQSYSESDSKNKKQKAEGKAAPKGCGSNCEIM